MEHIDEFLAGLSKEELKYIADKCEMMLGEQENSMAEKDEGEVSMEDFE
jgi:hypothetical protein